MCTPCSECVADVYVDVKQTPGYRIHLHMHWCPEHLFQSARNTHCKKKHIYTCIHTYGYAYICTRACMRIHDTAQHADTPLLRLTIYAQICIHIHIHTYIHAYVYLYIYTCIYMRIYMFLHIHTYTYIHTHIQNEHMHARKNAWNDGAAATVREDRLDTMKFSPSPCPLQSGGRSPAVAGSPIAPFSRNDE